MVLRFAQFCIGLWMICSPLALADQELDKSIAEATLREGREIISRELFGHYDITHLEFLKIKHLPVRSTLGQDYGLVKVVLRFSSTRNRTKHASLNPNLFEPGNMLCQGWLYLHCGVPAGHVFAGELEMLLAMDSHGAWRVVTPHWRSRRTYSLEGYLVMGGREKERYVLFPKQHDR